MAILKTLWAHGGSLLWTLTVVQCAENIARNKPADQTGAFDSLYASKAVDGVYGETNGGQYYCAHPDTSSNEPAKWWVDLEDTYTVDNVTVYNTYDAYGSRRMEYFVISVGPSKDDRTDCGGTYTSTVPRGGHVTMSCNVRGRFVHFRRVRGFDIPRVALCEVEVYGYKAIDCSKCPRDVPCTPVRGCTQCAAGQIPPDCIRDCNDGMYGLNCTTSCGKCRDSRICDKSSGICPSEGGCELWYAGNRCDVRLTVPDRSDETVTPGTTTNSTITVSWKQIKNLPSVPEGYYKYRVEYGTDRNNLQSGPIVLHKSSADTLNVTIDKLQYNTDYYVRVVPYREMRSNIGLWLPYGTVNIKTKCRAPDPPDISLQVEAGGEDAETIRVEYKIKLTGCNEITLALIEYRGQGSRDWISESRDVTKTTYILSPSGGGTYEVRVKVTNDGDISSHSDVIVQMIKGPPTTTTTTSAPVSQKGTNTDNPSGDSTTIIATVVVVVLLIVIAIGLVVFFIRKGKIKLPQKKKSRPEITRVDDPAKAMVAFMPIPPPNTHTKQKTIVQESQGSKVSPRPGTPDSITSVATASSPTPTPKLIKVDRPPHIRVNELDEYVAKKKTNMNAFATEYKNLPAEDKTKYKLAITMINKPKNRFANIYAYDENRVILEEEIPGQGDYINANYILGYNGSKEYIATQGARPATVPELWRMIWQHQANRIVMVANLIDDGKKRCAQYWPVDMGATTTVGDFTITTEAIEPCADYTTRIFSVKHGNESRTVRQFHFTSWEDKNKPLHGAITLFAFYNKVRSFDRMSKGPMIVHCSAGVGRTGTFIAFDYLLHQAEEEGLVDIYGCVEKLRTQRMLMVQTKEQYFFLHDALAEYLKCGRTSYPCNDFVETFRKINAISDQLGGISEIDRQFNILTAVKTGSRGQGKDGLREANKAKNRSLDIIPDDDCRPYLSTIYKQGTNYINALFVPSFKAHGYYIVTQMPLPHTMIDFWRLVHDMNCHSVVMLNSLDKDDETCQPYWPDEDEPKQRYGPVEVELLKINSENMSKSITTRDFRVILASDKRNIDTENGEDQGLIVRQFQLMSWPKEKELPSTHVDLLELFDQLQRWQQQRKGISDEQNHTLVHCMNGVDRCGMFCASSHTLDRMKIEQEVDAFLAVRYVARKRQQFINTKAQYTFLYQLAIACMSRYNEYANFDVQ